LKSLGRRVVRALQSHGIVVQAVYLFGSRARSEATQDSDIDLLVVSPHFAREGFWQRCAHVGAALGELPEPVEAYPVTVEEFRHPEPGGFLESIRPQLKVLYRRSRASRPARLS
jgi:predicted nucleotidyltransferase